jgi:hypothetical protein
MSVEELECEVLDILVMCRDTSHLLAVIFVGKYVLERFINIVTCNRLRSYLRNIQSGGNTT